MVLFPTDALDYLFSKHQSLLLLQKVAMLVSCLESFSKSLVHLLLPEGSRCWGSSCHEIEKPRSGQL